MGMGDQRHAPAALPPGKKPLFRKLGDRQGRPVSVREISPPTSIRSQNRQTDMPTELSRRTEG